MPTDITRMHCYMYIHIVSVSFFDSSSFLNQGLPRLFLTTFVATLENLVELSEGVLQTLGSKDEQKSIPKFVQLCEKLNLSDKVSERTRFLF